MVDLASLWTWSGPSRTCWRSCVKHPALQRSVIPAIEFAISYGTADVHILQIEDELAKQLSQMKLMIQGTQGRLSSTPSFTPSYSYTDAIFILSRNRYFPRAGAGTGSGDASRRPTLPTGSRHSHAPLRSEKRHPDHILPRPPIQTGACHPRRPSGYFIHCPSPTRNHSTAMPWLQLQPECDAMRYHLARGTQVRRHCCDHSFRPVPR